MSLYANGWREPVPGPRIERLKADLRTGDRDALLAEFWAEVARTGAPLVADIPGDPDAAAVTFLWRDPVGGLDHVVLGGALVIVDHGPNLLRRLRGTDVLALTLRLPRDARSLYAFGFGIPIGRSYAGGLMPWMKRDDGPPPGTWQLDPLNPAPPFFNLSRLDLAPDADAEVTSWLSIVPPGILPEHRIASTTLGEERRYWVHLPDGPVENVVWAFDGHDWGRMAGALQVVTEGLTAREEIGPTAVVFIDSPDDRRQQDMTFDIPFADYVRDELVPDARARYGLPEDPAVNLLHGYSGGGTAVAFLALRAPHLFGRAIAAAGSMGCVPFGGGMTRHLYDRYRENPPMNTRFAVTVGDLEVDRFLDLPSLYDGALEFAAVLDELGIHSTLYTGPYGHDAFGSRILMARALPELLPRRKERENT